MVMLQNVCLKLRTDFGRREVASAPYVRYLVKKFKETRILIFFSEEAHFDLGVYVNKQNCRICGTENSHAYIEKSTDPKQVTVWCGFWFRGTVGPLFFENEQGEAL